MELKKDKLYICFHKGKGVIGRLISLWTLGRYSHVEFVHNGLKYLSNPGGVRCEKYEHKKHHDLYELHEHIEFERVYDAFMNLRGKKYDYWNIFLNQLLKLGIEHKDEYICSEFCLYCINNALDRSLTYKLKTLKCSDFSPNKLYRYLKFMELLGKEVE